ncbi:MAG: helix-turn-helix domain-containing protein [Gammaproteobacteria bacterium]
MSNLKQKIAKSSLSERLRSLMQEKSISIQKLSKETGIGFGAIQKILADPNSNPTYVTLKALSRAFDVSIGYLLNEPTKSAVETNKIRIINWEQIMDCIDASGSSHLTNLDSFVMCNLDLNEQAFALKLTTKELKPFFNENTILIFDPHKKPYHRAFVLVKLKEDETPLFKQLIINESKYYLKPISDDNSNKTIKIMRPKDRIIATLVQSLSNF